LKILFVYDDGLKLAEK